MSRLARVQSVILALLGRPWFGACLMLLSLWRFAVLGKGTPILIFDNADSNLIWLKILGKSGKLFASNDSIIPNIMGGLPRSYWDSELNVLVWLHVWFKPFTAYVLNQALIVFFAFLGMWLLVDRHLLSLAELGEPAADHTRVSRLSIVNGTAACFSLLPFWPAGGLSVAGMPLVLNALLNIGGFSQRPRSTATKVGDWLSLTFFPLYSTLVCSFGLQFVAAAIFLWQLSRRVVNLRFALATAVLTIAQLIAEHRLVETMLIAGQAASHRVEFHHKLVTFARGVWDVRTLLFDGEYHAVALQALILVPVVFLVTYIAGIRTRSARLFWTVLGALFLTSIVYGLFEWRGLRWLYHHVSLVRSFNFRRVHWLQPMLWYSAFALALYIAAQHFSRWPRRALALVIAVIVVQGGYILKMRHNRHVIGGPEIAYEKFFAERQFSQIRDFIGKPQDSYRVVSVGMHPAVSQHNGFYTLDGYVANYPLAYKKKFRKIIAPALARSRKDEKYFDNWGNRAYIFDKSLTRTCRAECIEGSRKKKWYRLGFDRAELYRQGGRYVLSAVRIRAKKGKGLKFLKVFEDPTSVWKIYLYEVEPPAPPS